MLLIAGMTAACSGKEEARSSYEDITPVLNYGSRSGYTAYFKPLVAPPNANPEKVSLGKALFSDSRLSADNTISCATCHDLSNGGDDGLPVAIGIDGKHGPVNTPTVINASLNIAQFWDGRAADLKTQVSGPIHNPLEMGSTWDEVVGKLAADQATVSEFESVYPGEPLTGELIADAIAAYEAQLISTDSPFDRFLLGDENAISSAAKEGLHTFVDLGCVACHQGKNLGSNMYQQFGVIGSYFEDRGNLSEADYGRFNITGREEDKYYFKVPSLRNIVETAPYFHDGSVDELSEAVRIMARYQLGRPISDDQINTIVAFLETLSGTVNEEML